MKWHSSKYRAIEHRADGSEAVIVAAAESVDGSDDQGGSCWCYHSRPAKIISDSGAEEFACGDVRVIPGTKFFPFNFPERNVRITDGCSRW